MGALISADGVSATAPAIGLQYPAQAAPQDLAQFAGAAEDLGYDSVYVVEDCFLSGSVALAAVALQATTRVKIGIGLMPAAIRNPALAAMELATLAEMFPRRLTVAFGHGVESWMGQIGARPRDRVVALEETVDVVRRLLAGETVSTRGRHVTLDAVALDNPPSTPPAVLVGTTGAKTLAAAGRCADGVLFPEGCGPAFVRGALAGIGARAAGQRRPWRTVVYAWLSLDEPQARAADWLRPAVAHWLDGGLYPAPLRAALQASGGAADPANSALVREISVCGSPAECRGAIAGLAAVGADEIVLAPQAPGLEDQIGRFAREVLPTIAGA